MGGMGKYSCPCLLCSRKTRAGEDTGKSTCPCHPEPDSQLRAAFESVIGRKFETDRAAPRYRPTSSRITAWAAGVLAMNGTLAPEYPRRS